MPINLLLGLWVCVLVTPAEANVRGCIKAAARIRERGLGTTETSCMSCDPAKPVCPT